jgi:hypothetical protein
MRKSLFALLAVVRTGEPVRDPAGRGAVAEPR